MGTCAKCLATEIRDLAPNAQNGAITVQIIENPPMPTVFTHPDLGIWELDSVFREWAKKVALCGICNEHIAKFQVSCYQGRGA